MKKLCVLYLMVAFAFPAEGKKSDLVLRGQITFEQNQTYQEVPFDVPPGVTRLTIDFSYSGRDERTTIDLGLWDPERFRGWSGGNKNTFTLAVSDATPSYLAGPLPSGRWKLVLGIPNVRPGVKSDFTAHVTFTRAGGELPESAFGVVASPPARHWYRGDLHLHTAHSDGSCSSQKGMRVPCPVFKTVEAAVARGLDFIAITDHNTTAQYDAMRELQAYFDRLLLIPGREVTTFHGHANLFGPTDFIDFRVANGAVPDVNALLRSVEAAHGLVSINHPTAPSGEACMGCGWSFPDTDFSKVQAIEAVNGVHSEDAYSGVPFWEDLLRRGYRLTAIGGSDNHDAEKALDQPGSVGYPETVVHAEALTQAAILSAIQAGHVFLDLAGSKDRLLEMTAKKEGKAVAEMGDTVALRSGDTIAFSIHTENVPGEKLALIQDGQSHTLDGKSLEWTSDGKRHWFGVTVRAQDGRLALLGNPIYVNY